MVARTLVDELVGQAERRPDVAAVTFKREGSWLNLTWRQVLDEVQVLFAGLRAFGVLPGDRVALFANSSLEWVLLDCAIQAAGAITVPIYGSNTPDEMRYILVNSGAVLCFVDNDTADGRQAGRLTRVRSRWAECSALRKVILIEGSAVREGESTLDSLREQGRAAHQAHPTGFDAQRALLREDEVTHFIYTSGTTGDPKGVMLTHGNWNYEAKAIEKFGILLPSDSVMLFLPLAHVFAQAVKAGWLALGFRLVIAESVDKLMQNLPETNPSILPAVPRVFEKVYNGVVANGSGAPGFKGRLFRWAMAGFDRYVAAREAGRAPPLSFALARWLVFAKVRRTLDDKLGRNLRLFVSGGAPLARKIAYFFDVLGYVVSEGYGLTEVCAAATVGVPGRMKIGTVGEPLVGTEVKIASDGEVLIRGGGVMKGYYKNPEATAEVLSPEGWFHTGDIGEIDADGQLRITDRKKDLIISAGGKNIAPQNIENLLKAQPLISQAMVYGDRRPYLTVLVTVSEEAARKLLQAEGVTASYAQLAAHPQLHQAVEAAVRAVNAQLPPYSTLKRFCVLDHDLSQESGELTPTLKVKRKFVTQKYKAQLEQLYDERALE